jgi:hypothetical protein
MPAGAARCWGLNDGGNLGNGNSTRQDSPVDVIGLTGATQISAGLSHTCALMPDGGIKCWGFNFDGQLGVPGITQSFTPIDVAGLT